MKQTSICEHVDCIVVYEVEKSCPLCMCREIGRDLDAVNILLSETSFDEGLDPKLAFLGKES